MIVMDILWRLYESITPFQAAFATSVLLFYLVYLFLKDNDLPPGPLGFPILGFYPFVKPETLHLQLKDMVHKYGDIYSFRVMGTLFIHLGSIKAIKDAHVTHSDCFAGRTEDYGVGYFLFQGGLAVINGEPWKVLRKFFVMKFKEYGMNASKENVTDPIQDALKETMEKLHNSKAQPISITDLATDNCMPIMRRILFHDQGIKMEELKQMLVEYQVITNNLTMDVFLLFGNITKYLLSPFMPKVKIMKQANSCIQDILFDVVNRHKRDYDENQITDIIDSYIKERDERTRKGDPTAKYLTDKALVSTLHQLVNDGILFVGLLISTFLTKLIEYPEEQERIYEELIEVIGPERPPSMEDKNKLPRTNAFMYEVLRVTDLFPIFPSLQCTKETTIQGHKIPKGAITLVNSYAAHHNPNTYDNPEAFDPSRYLTSSDKQRAELPIQFGVGKRSCIGEGFTLLQSFLFITTIVKTFRLTLPEGVQLPSNVYSSQEKLFICAIPRSHK